MNYGALIFLAAFFGLATSWFAFVLKPVVQLGGLQQTNTLAGSSLYPLARPGLAHQGLEVYRANGCATCHSQQIVQSGSALQVLLTEPGTNQTALLSEISRLRGNFPASEAQKLVANLPVPILTTHDRATAESAVKQINATTAKATIWVAPFGPDIARGWGKRRTVAEDFLFDQPALPGALRAGPDLANVGTRLPDANWHLRHLYAPRSEVKGSLMPPYRYLFEKRRSSSAAGSSDALVLPSDFAPESGYEIVPKPDAIALVAYLASLKADAPLFTSPVSVASSASSTTSTNSAGTNAAAAKAESK